MYANNFTLFAAKHEYFSVLFILDSVLFVELPRNSRYMVMWRRNNTNTFTINSERTVYSTYSLLNCVSVCVLAHICNQKFCD